MGDELGCFKVGLPVWYRSTHDIGWWPCLVTAICEEDERKCVGLKALGDGYEFGLVTMKSSIIIVFTCPNCNAMVKEQIRRLKSNKRKRDLTNFVIAVREALIHYPSFQLDVELPNEGTPSPPKSPSIGHYWSFLNDSNIFTPGSGSKPTSSIRRSARRQSSTGSVTPVASSDTPSHSAPQRYHVEMTNTTESAPNSDILVRVAPNITSENIRRSKRRKNDRNSSTPASERKKRRREKLTPTKNHKEEEKEEVIDDEHPIPVAKKLFLDDSQSMEEDVEGTDIPPMPIKSDILSVCNASTCTNLVSSVGECGNDRGRCAGVANGEVKGGGDGCGEDGEIGENGVGRVSVLGELGDHGVSGENGVGDGSNANSKVIDDINRSIGHGENGTCTTVRMEDKLNTRETMKGEEVVDRQREGTIEEEEKDKDEEVESSDDEYLPSYEANTSTEVIVNDLKEGDQIWLKYHTFPYWPALVVRVCPHKKLSKQKAWIVYFGDNPDYKPVIITHKHRKKLARFVYRNKQTFMRAGRECGGNAEYFLRSVKEAETFLAAKCNKELCGSTHDMFKQICERRPPSLTPCISFREQSFLEKVEAPKESAFGYRLDSDTGDEEGSEVDEAESEPEDEDPMYNLDIVLKHFTEIKSILHQIMSGAIYSEYHHMYNHGSSKERHKLKICPKYGPTERWKRHKRLALHEKLETIARERDPNIQLDYTMDVLLPEAMIQTISHFEKISTEEAQKRL